MISTPSTPSTPLTPSTPSTPLTPLTPSTPSTPSTQSTQKRTLPIDQRGPHNINRVNTLECVDAISWTLS
ncbi:hypothetical protein PGT21_011283 [Puccinia graminis f. sp. tritici]|uniref:Uncharacterized protein n=1 Tax=Puccinia graminis f. sp. tritici TaxID=56615 RepID=A0A5B0NAQ7_PUCGR|nr:hypothetical protein PGT21_011283 [Puccinia graminis f. sp. tritici]KAA1135973.1 hypothetical protein PGTUg99_014556 [Puccinia graminis f. sp. tritici]